MDQLQALGIQDVAGRDGALQDRQPAALRPRPRLAAGGPGRRVVPLALWSPWGASLLASGGTHTAPLAPNRALRLPGLRHGAPI